MLPRPFNLVWKSVSASLACWLLLAHAGYAELPMPPDPATRPAGTVVDWGAHGDGQTTLPLGLSDVVAVAAGPASSLALKSDGTLVQWGYVIPGQNMVPVDLGPVVAIAAGFKFGLALRNDGTVATWGIYADGFNYLPITTPAGLNHVVAIAAGSHHALALKSDGTVVAWGDNYAGKSTVPLGLTGVVAIAAASGHSLALKSDGTVVAWGWNGAGQTTVPMGLSGVTAISAGHWHSLAVKSDGTVTVWGNDYGSGPRDPVLVPAGLNGVVAVAADDQYTSLALKNDGTVVAWGFESSVPFGLSGVIAVAAGTGHRLALVRNSGPPNFSLDPQSQTSRAAMAVAFTASANGALPMSYQWQFNGVAIARGTNATLTLTNAQPGNAGRYSVRASNSAGSATSQAATLAVLADPASGTPSTPVVDLAPPPKAIGQDGLIVITHGWQPAELLVWNVAWMEDMASTIRQKLAGQPNWQVRTIDWKELAFWPEPELPLLRATVIGNLVGRRIASQSWNHVHLIGHSAGSALIQEAARRIKIASPATTIHTTFLDPDFGLLLNAENRLLYGQYADWSDAYFARDITGVFTSAVPRSHSVDVTDLDANRGNFFEVLHAWPHKFYTRTVTNGFAGTIGGDPSLGYGFPLSMEGGGWANRGSYPIPNTPVVLNSFLPITLPESLPANTRPVINLTKLSVSGNNFAVSSSGTGQIFGDLFQFQNGGSLAPQSQRNSMGSTAGREVQSLMPASVPVLEPAWISLGVTVTNLVNYVKFDASFTSATGAEGLFSVYWGTSLLGELDERTAGTGLQTYQFRLPETYSDGQYTLGFRLDAFTTTPSSLTLTNVLTGFIGITNPPALTVAASATNGPAQVTLSGATGFYSILQTSTNLTNWTPVAALVNSNGTVQFSDFGATNQARRYYRAVVP